MVTKETLEESNPEEETLNKIKFVLSCNNDAQAIRLLEQYGHWKQERMYSEEEVYDIVAQTISRFCPSFGNKIKIEITKEWFEQFKKK